MLLILTTDALSRVDIDTIPHQDLLELLIENVTETVRWKDKAGEYLDIIDWHGVLLNRNCEVEEIQWSYFHKDPGTLQFQYLPPTLQALQAGKNFSGHLTALDLPRPLTRCDLNQNRITGEICAKELPERLVELHIAKNQFCGTFEFSSLPRTLRWLNIQENAFVGEANLENLPEMLETLRIHNNQFCGTVRVVDIPQTMKWVDVGANVFEEDGIFIGAIPDAFRNLNAVSSGVVRFADVQGNTVVSEKISFEKRRRARK